MRNKDHWYNEYFVVLGHEYVTKLYVMRSSVNWNNFQNRWTTLTGMENTFDTIALTDPALTDRVLKAKLDENQKTARLAMTKRCE